MTVSGPGSRAREHFVSGELRYTPWAVKMFWCSSGLGNDFLFDATPDRGDHDEFCCVVLKVNVCSGPVSMEDVTGRSLLLGGYRPCRSRAKSWFPCRRKRMFAADRAGKLLSA